jgi:hypothetical protein
MQLVLTAASIRSLLCHDGFFKRGLNLSGPLLHFANVTAYVHCDRQRFDRAARIEARNRVRRLPGRTLRHGWIGSHLSVNMRLRLSNPASNTSDHLLPWRDRALFGG